MLSYKQATMCMYINDSTSKTLPVLSGIPQGPNSYMLMIYIPSSVLNSKLLLFADDYKSIANITDMTLLQEDVVGASTTFLILMSIN